VSVVCRAPTMLSSPTDSTRSEPILPSRPRSSDVIHSLQHLCVSWPVSSSDLASGRALCAPGRSKETSLCQQRVSRTFAVREGFAAGAILCIRHVMSTSTMTFLFD
jgi:hypothetical protein